MILILTRHGQTIENLKGIHQGQVIQGTLSKKGINQAKKLALRLKDEKIDVIYSSDLARTADTTKEIAKYHLNIPVNYVKELRERDTKSFGGKLGRELDWDNMPKGAETRSDMKKRIKKLLDKVYEKYPDETILFVGHNGINKALLREILNKSDDYEVDKLSNASISIFEIKEDKNHKIHLINCTKHLE